MKKRRVFINFHWGSCLTAALLVLRLLSNSVFLKTPFFTTPTAGAPPVCAPKQPRVLPKIRGRLPGDSALAGRWVSPKKPLGPGARCCDSATPDPSIYKNPSFLHPQRPFRGLKEPASSPFLPFHPK